MSVCVCVCMLLSLCMFGNVGMHLSMSTQQEKGDLGPKRDIDGMGVPEIKYGDSVCFIMHVATGLWLSYLAPDAKSSRLGPLKRRVKTRKLVFHNFHFTALFQRSHYNELNYRTHIRKTFNTAIKSKIILEGKQFMKDVQ